THITSTTLSLTPHPFSTLNDTAPPAIYTLSLHDALPISRKLNDASGEAGEPVTRAASRAAPPMGSEGCRSVAPTARPKWARSGRSEEHTSELQSRGHLVCRLLLEKKKKN